MSKIGPSHKKGVNRHKRVTYPEGFEAALGPAKAKSMGRATGQIGSSGITAVKGTGASCWASGVLGRSRKKIYNKRRPVLTKGKSTADLVIDRLEKLLLEMAGVNRRFERLEELAARLSPTLWQEVQQEFEPSTDA